jgi:2,4-dienoyl-CoA reductase-like NADH-dependent reductase (Old Yellow Enzyme family)
MATCFFYAIVWAEGKTFTANGFEKVSKPRALATEEIPSLLAEYRHAARAAKRAGFDGVEVHSANSYLLDQFVRDSVNQRTDQYGGSVANRTRLTLEVVAAVVDEWQDSGRVGIRLSPTTPDAGNTPPDSDVMGTYGYLIQQLNQFNLACLHFVEGSTATSRELPAGVDLGVLRRQFAGPYVANNGYTLELAQEAWATGSADVIAFGCPLIANPDRPGGALASRPTPGRGRPRCLLRRRRGRLHQLAHGGPSLGCPASSYSSTSKACRATVQHAFRFYLLRMHILRPALQRHYG